MGDLPHLIVAMTVGNDKVCTISNADGGIIICADYILAVKAQIHIIIASPCVRKSYIALESVVAIPGNFT